jgi:hypothetical protein
MPQNDLFELSCHHTYATFDGLPVDMSDYDCHGRAQGTTFLADGASAGSGALRFAGTDRVEIPRKQVWEKLKGIRVEVTARLNGPTGTFQTLVNGHQSFGFHLVGYHASMPLALAAYYHDSSAMSASGITGLSTYEDAPDSGQPGFLVPYGTWVSLVFLHDGFSMRLFVNDQLVAVRSTVLSGVPGVGPSGVFIGNRPGHDAALNGDIDDVKVWRLNPHIVDTAFFARPIDRESADCLDRFLRQLATALQSDPDCAQQLYRAFTGATDKMLRAIMALGPETRERLNRTSRRYFQLWHAGKLDSPEMAQLLSEWCAWLRLAGVGFEHRELEAFLRSDCVKKLLARCVPLDCDRELAAMMKLLARTCSDAVPNSRI